jgi:sulfate adenylyltransferase subunit 1
MASIIGNVDTLRFSTAGSVDDGKSTLIGRLLYDAHGILRDQIATLTDATQRHGHAPAGEAIDFSLLTDGLIAEREQGITIDVAYRYFTTPKRRFIIADTPGHEQYTRNMVTGASTADLAIVLIDAEKGISVQSRRHAVIASLLGIAHVVVAINKMDLVGYEEAVFTRIRDEFAPFLAKLGINQVTFTPISALKGEMLANRGLAMPWFQGHTLLETLETTTAHQATTAHFRFPVQRVAKAKFGAKHDLRGYQGTIAGGRIAVGETITALPSGLTAKVAAIHTIDADLPSATAGMAVTLVLDRQIDISRGDMLIGLATSLAKPKPDNELNDKPYIESALSANLCWFDPSPLDFSKRYWLKHTTQQTRAVIEKIDSRLNIDTLHHETDATTLAMNDIGVVSINVQRPLIFDAYADNRQTGSFVLIDDTTNRTVAAGMILPDMKAR